MAQTIKTPLYEPGINNAANIEELKRFIDAQLSEISEALKRVADGHLDPVYVAPVKPRDGDIRYADGTSWNPGAGEGVYSYIGGSWQKL